MQIREKESYKLQVRKKNYKSKEIRNFYQAAKKTRQTVQRVLSCQKNKDGDLMGILSGKYVGE